MSHEKVGILTIAALLALSLSLLGCIRHAKPAYELVHRPGYAYQRINEGEFAVVSVDQKSLMAAMAEIGCGAKYICELSVDGELYTVELHTK